MASTLIKASFPTQAIRAASTSSARVKAQKQHQQKRAASSAPSPGSTDAAPAGGSSRLLVVGGVAAVVGLGYYFLAGGDAAPKAKEKALSLKERAEVLKEKAKDKAKDMQQHPTPSKEGGGTQGANTAKVNTSKDAQGATGVSATPAH